MFLLIFRHCCQLKWPVDKRIRKKSKKHTHTNHELYYNNFDQCVCKLLTHYDIALSLALVWHKSVLQKRRSLKNTNFLCSVSWSCWYIDTILTAGFRFCAITYNNKKNSFVKFQQSFRHESRSRFLCFLCLKLLLCCSLISWLEIIYVHTNKKVDISLFLFFL